MIIQNFCVVLQILLFKSWTTTVATQPPDHPPFELQIPDLDDPDHWEHLLREFIFKTISPPPLRNNDLYKRVLKAPFYRGPVLDENNDLEISRGSVYVSPRWIFCQDNCTECAECASQKNAVVKWALRRVKKFGPFNEPRYELQFTIIPQYHGNWEMENREFPSYVYVVNEKTRIDDENNNSMKEDQEKLAENSTFGSRIILGSDGDGGKYLVQILRTNFPGVSNESGKVSAPSRLGRAVSGPYRNVLNRATSSLNSHRQFIEDFLASDKGTFADSRSGNHGFSEAVETADKSFSDRVVLRDDGRFDSSLGRNATLISGDNGNDKASRNVSLGDFNANDQVGKKVNNEGISREKEGIKELILKAQQPGMKNGTAIKRLERKRKRANSNISLITK